MYYREPGGALQHIAQHAGAFLASCTPSYLKAQVVRDEGIAAQKITQRPVAIADA